MKPLCLSNFVKTVGAICAFLMPLAASAQAWIDINETNFPDANFRSFLQSKYGGNRITETALEATTEMSCGYGSIKNLKGIEFFTNLKTLNCSNNQLEYLNVSALTKLETLNCANNKLISLSVANNTKLTELDCQNNQLRALYIGTNKPNLTSVFCYNNQMNYSAMRKLVASLPSVSGSDYHFAVLWSTDTNEQNSIIATSWLTGWLPCSYDKTSGSAHIEYYEESDEPAPIALDAAHFPDEGALLTVLKTYDTNKDGYLSAAENYKITTVDVSGKSLTSLLCIQYLTNLQKLNCSNNDLTTLDLSKNPFLIYLECYQNRLFDDEMDNLITSLPPVLHKDCYSVTVTSSSNGIAAGILRTYKATSSSPWEGNVFTPAQYTTCAGKSWIGMKSTDSYWSPATEGGELHINPKTFPDETVRWALTYNCYYNTPNYIDANKNGYLSETERAAVKVIYWDVDFESQNMRDMGGHEYFYNLEDFTCNTTQLSKTVNFRRNKKLTIVRIEQSNLADILLPWRVKVVEIHTTNNNFKNFSLQGYSQLESFYIQAPNLQSLTTSYNRNLTNLDVTSCKNLKNLNLTYNTKLTHLYITNSGISKINVSMLGDLNTFYCNMTPLTELDLSKNPNLVCLNCSNCSRLIDLDLTNNTKLQSLDCSHSALMWLTLPSSCSSLTDLSIQGNYLNDAQINAIVGKLPIVSSSGTERYICLSYSDASEMNMIGFSRVKTLINTKKWKVRFEKDASNVYYYQATNAIYGNNNSSNDKRLNFWLNNSEKVSGITFDLVLPEDITLAQANGKFVVTGSTKVPASGINVTFTGTDPKTKANIYHVSLSKSGGITATTGENVMALEIFPLRSGTFYSNCINTYMRTTLGQDIYVGPYSGTITITKPYTLGDVNKDGQITPADAIMILYNYFDVEQNGFDEKLADVNKDGQITPADAIEALYMYFQEDTPAASRKTDKPSATETAIPDPE